jgi:hypothetical protein
MPRQYVVVPVDAVKITQAEDVRLVLKKVFQDE